MDNMPNEYPTAKIALVTGASLLSEENRWVNALRDEDDLMGL